MELKFSLDAMQFDALNRYAKPLKPKDIVGLKVYKGDKKVGTITKAKRVSGGLLSVTATIDSQEILAKMSAKMSIGSINKKTRR